MTERKSPDTPVSLPGARRLPADVHATAVLARRAQQLAMPSAATATSTNATSGETLHYLRVRLHGQGWFGIPRDCALEVILPDGMAAIPGVPAHIAGVVSVRGDMITVLDLPAWFGIGRVARSDAGAVVIVESGDTTTGMIAGLLVTELRCESACTTASLTTPLEGAVIPAKYVIGIHDAEVTVLDIAAIMSDPNIMVNN